MSDLTREHLAGVKLSAQAPPAPRPRGVFSKLLTLLRGGEEKSLRERLRYLVRMRDDRGERLTPIERHMLMNTLSFGEKRVLDVMVPRADIVAIEENAGLDEILRICGESAHSRMPVFRETLDDPIGMLHIKDVLAWMAKDESERGAFSLLSLRRDALFVPPSMRALDLLLKMQSTRVHLALVIDEYGGTDGLVTIEDLVEEIVGDIEDEHDEPEEPDFVWRDDGTLMADARASIEDLEDMIGMKLVDEEFEDDADTLAGLLFTLVGRVPQRGELISHPLGLEFEVRDADPRRIKRLRIHLPARNPNEDDPASASAPASADAGPEHGAGGAPASGPDNGKT